jgi:type IV secretion system protein VirB10
MKREFANEPLLENDVRPVVGYDRGNRPLWFGLTGIVLIGAILFGVLENRRQIGIAPSVQPRATDLRALPQALPSLYVPPELRFAEKAQIQPDIPRIETPHRTLIEPSAPPRAPPVEMVIRQREAWPLQSSAPPLAAPRVDTSQAIVFDATVGESGAPDGSASSTPGVAIATAVPRRRASRSVNRATMVSQGTLIAAVLETALDSSQPGLARALVSRDVKNFHGSKVLIPRGSRLFGTYDGQIAAGQNRAQVQWTRLVRPDGVNIAIDSPAADRLGRAGIKGRLNSHFFERFGGALLQSSIDIGTAVATRGISNDGVIIAFPQAAQGATWQLIGQPPKPTLTVKAGTRITVFVFRDLDFTDVEGRR